ncbi:uncharacterized protein AMSG_08632 [Thecamonas trahens ATCC 50062]|uniref:PPM-type phosphatase domain-containing protein n=1 Tax=Thecamonas trahens ATCC 50062 TaxID=461836 RepID=A0A0L0DKK0_THETB|nr:hypothetical protein AMSG_08632 [Thecamonas trahens ATCC 50062]KNC52750.1 hypothetical protein AMSG_08632 [Thecamonas trahens ATCC 50062]|eukprot:XP_013755063.1 hypothetical protein AMSG_08632 [Thecamonas trahens ATCC 50062]
MGQGVVCIAADPKPPAVYHAQLTSSDAFVVLGCDGLWDMFTSAEVVDMVFEWMDAPGPYTNCADYLVARVLDKAARPFVLFAGADEPIKALVSQPARKRRRMYDDTTVAVVFLDTDKLAAAATIDLWGGYTLVSATLRSDARAWAIRGEEDLAR